MTRIKICGIKNGNDIDIMNRYLPDYVGFVFANSKRRVEFVQALALIEELNPAIFRVGVFVNEEIDSLIETVTGLNLDVVQLSGDETPEYLETARMKIDSELKKQKREKQKREQPKRAKPIEIWKGFRVENDASLASIAYFRADAFLLDTYVKGSFGGSGKTFNWEIAKTFNWEIAKSAAKKVPIVLAGGLNSANINTAIREVAPYAVDVSSGVEGLMGKDESKIKDFIKNVKGAKGGVLDERK